MKKNGSYLAPRSPSGSVGLGSVFFCPLVGVPEAGSVSTLPLFLGPASHSGFLTRSYQMDQQWRQLVGTPIFGKEYKMAEQWYYSKNNQQQGPVSPEQLKQLAASGQLQPSDLVWKEGMGQWVEARKLKGLFPTETTPPMPPPVPTVAKSASPPIPVTAPAIPSAPSVTTPSNSPTSGEAPALWNPKWLGAWSLLLTWGFGSILLAHNWRTLGSKGRALRCMIWFYAVIPYLIWSLLPFMSLIYFGVSGSLPIIVTLLIAWGFGSILLAHNWKTLGSKGRALRCMIWFYAVIPYLIWSLLPFMSLIYFGVQGSLPIIVTILIAWVILGAWVLIEMRPQIAYIHDHLGKSYPQKSWGRPIGVWTGCAAVFFIAGVCILHPFFRELEDNARTSLGFGYDKSFTKLTFNGSTLFYKPPVTEVEANRLGRFLVAGQWLGEGYQVAIAKSGSTYEYYLKIQPGAEHNQKYIKAWEVLSDQLSANIFGDAPVDIHLCNNACYTIRVVNPHR